MALAGMRADASKDCLETHQNVTRITNKYHRKSNWEQDSYTDIPLQYHKIYTYIPLEYPYKD